MQNWRKVFSVKLSDSAIQELNARAAKAGKKPRTMAREYLEELLSSEKAAA